MVDYHPNEPVYVAILFFAALGLLCSGTSSLYIWLSSSRAATTARLLLYLHLSLLLEEICIIPFLYTGSEGLCRFVGFVQIYAGLSNIMAMALLVLYFVSYLTAYSQRLLLFITAYKEALIFAFPLITLLPLSTNAYGRTNEVFCGLPNDTKGANYWAIFTLHLWLWLALIGCCWFLFKTLYKAVQLDKSLAGKIFTTVGIYVMVTMAAWMERTIPRIMALLDPEFHPPHETYLVMVFVLYLMAIVYSVLLFLDPSVLREYGAEVAENERQDMHISWDDMYSVASGMHRSSADSNSNISRHADKVLEEITKNLQPEQEMKEQQPNIDNC